MQKGCIVWCTNLRAKSWYHMTFAKNSPIWNFWHYKNFFSSPTVSMFIAIPLKLYWCFQWPSPNGQSFLKYGLITPIDQVWNTILSTDHISDGMAAIFNTYLDLLISLIGAFTSTALTLIYPPILDTLTQVTTLQPSKLRTAILVKNMLILLLGVVGCVIGTYTSVAQLVDQLIKDNSRK